MRAPSYARAPRWVLLFLLAAPIVIGAVYQVTVARGKDEAEKMTQEIKTMSMKTICVGRFLLDVPSDAQISYRSAFLSGWDLDSDAEETEEAFEDRLRGIEAKLRNSKDANGIPKLEAVKVVDGEGRKGKIFLHGRETTHWFEYGKRVDSTFVRVDAWVRVKGISFGFAREIGKETDVNELLQLIAKLEPRSDDLIPSQSGFCFEGALLRDPLTADQNERVGVFVGLKGHPDVAIAANTMAGLKHDRTLLQREATNNVKQSNLGNFKDIRSGPRALNGLPGEEILEIVLEPNGTKAQSFMWESLPKRESVFRPYFVLEMSTGRGEPGIPVDSSLSDARALALWERISASLRLRPTSLPSTASEKSALPLGTRGSATDNCRQTGWWQCSDGGDGVDIVGGRRQYFTEGQVLPQAVVLTPPTLWQNIRGETPTFTSAIPSSWKLVDRRRAARNPSPTFLAQALPPVEVPGHSQDAPANPEAVAGAPVTSDLACPASGWWECTETKALDGTRWFARGHIMPPATVPVAVSLVEKMKGTPEFARVTANWRLVRVAEGVPTIPGTSPQPSEPDDSEKNPSTGPNDTATGSPQDA